MFWCSKEPSHWDGSFVYPQHMFWLRNKKIKFSLRTLSLSPAIICCNCALSSTGSILSNTVDPFSIAPVQTMVIVYTNCLTSIVPMANNWWAIRQCFKIHHQLLFSGIQNWLCFNTFLDESHKLWLKHKNPDNATDHGIEQCIRVNIQASRWECVLENYFLYSLSKTYVVQRFFWAPKTHV